MEMIELLEVTKPMRTLDLVAALGFKVEQNKSLAEFSSFKTGGPADYFLTAQTKEQVKKAITVCEKSQIPYFILGGGSNLLVSDDGFHGLVLKIDITGLEMISDTEFTCGAGEDLMALIEFSAKNSLTGLEFAAGIKGSVGGAICGNAGAYGGEIKDVLTNISLIDCSGKLKDVSPDYCRFAYRDSILKETHEIVLSASFKLAQGDKYAIRKKIDEIIEIRAGKHPVDGLTAGSFFKNIPDANEKHGKLPAGKLLEEAGAKKMSVGGARVYEKHANMIVNDGTATSKDIRKLADKLKEAVFDKFGIILEEEVISVGKF